MSTYGGTPELLELEATLRDLRLSRLELIPIEMDAILVAIDSLQEKLIMIRSQASSF